MIFIFNVWSWTIWWWANSNCREIWPRVNVRTVILSGSLNSSNTLNQTNWKEHIRLDRVSNHQLQTRIRIGWTGSANQVIMIITILRGIKKYAATTVWSNCSFFMVLIQWLYSSINIEFRTCYRMPFLSNHSIWWGLAEVASQHGYTTLEWRSDLIISCEVMQR